MTGACKVDDALTLFALYAALFYKDLRDIFSIKIVKMYILFAYFISWEKFVSNKVSEYAIFAYSRSDYHPLEFNSVWTTLGY